MKHSPIKELCAEWDDKNEVYRIYDKLHPKVTLAYTNNLLLFREWVLQDFNTQEKLPWIKI